jgi:hypothetical protein
MRGRVPSRAPGQSSSELEGVEGTLLTLENQASEFHLTTEKTTIEIIEHLFFYCIIIC